MKVLSIGSDRKLFEEGTAVLARTAEYAARAEEWHVVVFSLKSNGLQNFEMSPNVFVYPTNSLSRWSYVYDAIRLGRKIITERKFVPEDSIITCQDPFESGYVGSRLAKSFGLPLHVQIHTDFLAPSFKTSLLQRVRVWSARRVLPQASGVRVVSENIARSIDDAHIVLKNPVQILPIRIDIEAIDKAPKTDLYRQFPTFQFTIFLASRITPEKRIADALRACKKIIEKYPFVGVLIAGDGPERNRLERLSKDMGINDNVQFLGFRADVPSLMKSCSMFLSASEFEGYGMSIIEAGLCNCPIVSTDVGIARNFLKDGVNAFVCPVGDIQCLSSKIEKLISDNALRAIFTGRLQSDIRASIPEKEEYVKQYVKGLEEARSNI